MNVLVFNGSPKGELSVTLQYLKYIGKRCPGFDIDVADVAAEVGALERDGERFAALLERVRNADLVVWSFPVYVCLVSSQYKRFIELLFERNAGEAFRGKYAAAVSTSIRFFDGTAQSYVRSVCEDLSMKYLGFYSAKMEDLTVPEERERLVSFGAGLMKFVEEKVEPERMFCTAPVSSKTYEPGPVGRIADSGDKRIVILTDARDEKRDAGIFAMIRRLSAAFGGKAETVNLYDEDIRGGCLGCCSCGFENRCAYADGFAEFYTSKIRTADILIVAGRMHDRQLSWKIKQFLDRSFFTCHTPSLSGTQIAFLVSGSLSGNPGLREAYEAWAEMQRSHVIDFISDEGDGPAIDRKIDGLAVRIAEYSRSAYIRPQTFYGAAGRKLFRDEIYGHLRFVFLADHRAYKKLGFYDFPQKNLKVRLTNFVMTMLIGIPSFRKQFTRMIGKEMVRPVARIVETAAG